MTEQTLYQHLREMREHLTPPTGFTYPEISEGRFLMMVSPRPRHQLTAVDIRDQLSAQVPDGIIVAEATDTDDASLGTLRIPDLLVVPRAAMETDDPLDPREILLAVEIVSVSNPNNDYKDKSADYPAMGIPHYLIVDPRDGTWTYQWEIGRCEGRPVYENRLHLPYGKTVAIATELGEWTVETGDLPRYSAKDMMRQDTTEKP